MRDGNKTHRITVTISDNELVALEESLMVWTLCKKHNSKTWDSSKNRTATEQEIFKMQDECKECQKLDRSIHKKAWGVACKLFKVWDKR